MDTIQSAFGMQTEVQDNFDDLLIFAARGTFDIRIFSQMIFKFWFYFPEFQVIIDFIRLIVECVEDFLGYSPDGHLLKVGDKIIEQQKNPLNGKTCNNKLKQ